MKYQLINEVNPAFSAIEQVLVNRGIPYREIKSYLLTTDAVINSYEHFGMKNLREAASALIWCIKENKKAVVIIDSDCDGFTSSATLINYLYDLFPSWTVNNLTWFMHKGKQHGLGDYECPDDIDLIIVPDAGSNDYEEHMELEKKGKYVIILDHHEAPYISAHAITINNQLSAYPNKFMSGVGVVWQFCKYLDSLLNTNNADNYLDLVALGMDADMMSLTSFETKHLINKGFQDITNPFFAAMVEKNGYSMKYKVTPMSVAFYVAPFVNAIVRSGTQEEKELIFKSMLKFEAFKKVPSTKRGHKLGEMEQIYIQAIRTATNVKNRQTRAQEAGMEKLEKMIEEQSLLDHKVLLFLLKPGDIDKNIAGLVANKIMAKYQRPCCVLTRVEEDVYYEISITGEDGKTETRNTEWSKEISYQGSARGCDRAGVINFKNICEDTGVTLFAEGHQGAFGLGILELDLQTFIERTDEVLKDISDEAIYYVDYIYDGENVNPQDIISIADYPELWGKDVDEPFVAIKGLKITENMITLMSKDKSPTIKISLPNGVSIMKFGSSEEEYDSLSTKGYVELNIVGRCAINEWQGNRYPQILIEEYEEVDRVKYIF